MATQSQIDANRQNAQKSTGPRTEQGKAVSRFNAIKTGIHAESEVIPGEDPAELENLAAQYHQRFQPATPEEGFLVDSLVDADWQMRRLRKARAQLWIHEFKDASKSTFGPGLQQECPLGHVFDRATDNFVRFYRIIQAAERSYYRALRELKALQTGAFRSAPEPLVPDPQLLASNPVPPAPKLGSFRNTDSAAPPRTPDPAAVVPPAPGSHPPAPNSRPPAPASPDRLKSA